VFRGVSEQQLTAVLRRVAEEMIVMRRVVCERSKDSFYLLKV